MLIYGVIQGVFEFNDDFLGWIVLGYIMDICMVDSMKSKVVIKNECEKYKKCKKCKGEKDK